MILYLLGYSTKFYSRRYCATFLFVLWISKSCNARVLNSWSDEKLSYLRNAIPPSEILKKRSM